MWTLNNDKDDNHTSYTNTIHYLMFKYNHVPLAKEIKDFLQTSEPELLTYLEDCGWNMQYYLQSVRAAIKAKLAVLESVTNWLEETEESRG